MLSLFRINTTDFDRETTCKENAENPLGSQDHRIFSFMLMYVRVCVTHSLLSATMATSVAWSQRL